VALSGLFATTFPITVLTLAIPDMAEDLGVDQADLAWVVTLPILCSALTLPALGKLGDLYGHRRVFLTGFALAVVATALTATATGPLQLIGWRTVSQVFGGSTMPSSLALISAVHRGEKRAKAMGWWAMISAGAPVVGLTVGAPAIDAVGWQMLFLLQAALMVVPVLASWLVLRETPRHPAQFDIAGSVTLALGVGPLLLAVTQASEWGIASPAVIGCLALAAVGLLMFAQVEQRAAAPLLPSQLIHSREVMAAVGSSFFTSASYMGGYFLASLLLIEQFGYTATSAVPIIAIRPALFALSSPVGGRFTARVGVRATAVAGCVALTAGMIGLGIGSIASSLLVVILVGFLCQGIGYGLLRPALSTALANAVEEQHLGIASASERLAGQVGVAFGIAILATVYGGDTDRFGIAFFVGAAFGLAGWAASLALRRLRSEADKPPCPSTTDPCPTA
jgi:MFS family permease